MSKRVEVHNLGVAEARGRVGCSEVDLETFYIVRFFSDLLSGIFLRNLGTTVVLSNCVRESRYDNLGNNVCF